MFILDIKENPLHNYTHKKLFLTYIGSKENQNTQQKKKKKKTKKKIKKNISIKKKIKKKEKKNKLLII